jgi:nitrous oxide reductase accessory protein NosL
MFTFKEHREMLTEDTLLQERIFVTDFKNWLDKKLVKADNYTKATKAVIDLMVKKGGEGARHSIDYYSLVVAKQLKGVDTRTLADMVRQTLREAPQK